ncbi:hypothetical protein AB9M75_08150 [Lactobacillus sp. AN1001]
MLADVKKGVAFGAFVWAWLVDGWNMRFFLLGSAIFIMLYSIVDWLAFIAEQSGNK